MFKPGKDLSQGVSHTIAIRTIEGLRQIMEMLSWIQEEYTQLFSNMIYNSQAAGESFVC